MLTPSLPSLPLTTIVPGFWLSPTVRSLPKPKSIVLSFTVVTMLPSVLVYLTVSPSLTLSSSPFSAAMLKPLLISPVVLFCRSPTFTALNNVSPVAPSKVEPAKPLPTPVIVFLPPSIPPAVILGVLSRFSPSLLTNFTPPSLIVKRLLSLPKVALSKSVKSRAITKLNSLVPPSTRKLAPLEALPAASSPEMVNGCLSPKVFVIAPPVLPLKLKLSSLLAISWPL